MAQATVAIVDGLTNTGELKIYVDAVLVTTYSYGSDAFFLSERLTDIEVTREDLLANTKDIEVWHADVLRKCSVPSTFAGHELDVDDKANRIVYKLRYGESGETMAIHGIYHRGTQLFEFKARPALTPSPYEFARFVQALKLMLGNPPWV